MTRRNWRALALAARLSKRARISGEAMTGDGDLVSGVTCRRTAFEAIPEGDPPEEVRKLSA
jgi:hypothetical protein